MSYRDDIGADARRRGTYTTRGDVKINCINASTLGYCKWMASPGDMVAWRYSDGQTRSGRLFARVDAPADGPNCPAVKGFLAVLELAETFDRAYVRWIDPADVVEIRECPTVFPAFFFGDLPKVPEILRMDRQGSLSEGSPDSPNLGINGRYGVNYRPEK